jgi:hypothetical protein
LIITSGTITAQFKQDILFAYMDVTYNNSYINFNIENEKGFNIQFPTDLDLNITYRKTDNSVTGKHVVFPCYKSSYTIDHTVSPEWYLAEIISIEVAGNPIISMDGKNYSVIVRSIKAVW